MDSQGQLKFPEMDAIAQEDQKTRSSGHEKPIRRVVQDLLLDEGLWAVMRAEQHSTIESLRDDLFNNLKQQSKETRRRYVSSLIKWFFPAKELRSAGAQVWCAYRDRALTLEVLRVLYLKAEPIVGHCIDEFLHPIQQNAVIPASYFDTYLQTTLEEIPDKTRQRLKQNLRKLGFLARSEQGRDILRPLAPSGTALFLMFTYYFAQSEIRTVEVRSVLDDPFWKYLGFKSEDTVRKVFKGAYNRGFLGKYVVADQLELITTTLTFSACLEQRLEL